MSAKPCPQCAGRRFVHLNGWPTGCACVEREKKAKKAAQDAARRAASREYRRSQSSGASA